MKETCPNCEGAGGEYWDAPTYHNETQREWSSCRRCGGSGRIDPEQEQRKLQKELLQRVVWAKDAVRKAETELRVCKKRFTAATKAARKALQKGSK